MKRFLSIICVLLMCLWVSACTAAPQNSQLKDDKPWYWGSSSIYEYSEYSVSRYAYDAQGKNETLIGNGKLSFILDSINLINSVTQNTKTHLRLRMNFEIAVKEMLDGQEQNYNDSISSEVIFTSDGLTPIWMHKKAVITERKGFQPDSYELEACYDESYSYQSRFEYNGKQAHFAAPSFDEGNISDIDLKEGSYYDNEQLFYVIRAMSDLKTGAAMNMYLTNIYEIFNQNKFFTYLINVACGSDTVSLKTNDKIASLFNPDDLVDMDGGKGVDCLLVNAYINGKDRGVPFVLYYSSKPFASPATSNILMKMETSEYNSTSRAIANKTVYELIDYTAK